MINLHGRGWLALLALGMGATLGAVAQAEEQPLPTPFANVRSATAAFTLPLELEPTEAFQTLQRMEVVVRADQIAILAKNKEPLLQKVAALEVRIQAWASSADAADETGEAIAAEAAVLAPQVDQRLASMAKLVEQVKKSFQNRKPLKSQRAEQWRTYIILWRLGAQHRYLAWAASGAGAAGKSASERVDRALAGQTDERVQAWLKQCWERYRESVSRDPAAYHKLAAAFWGGGRKWTTLSPTERQIVVGAYADRLAFLAEWVSAEMDLKEPNDARVGRALAKLGHFVSVDAALAAR